MPKMEDKGGADKPVGYLKITHYENGALSVEGTIEDKTYVLSLLECAKDAIRNQRIAGEIVLPARDVQIEPQSISR